MFDNFDFAGTVNAILTWCGGFFWSVETAVQLGMIGISLGLAGFAARAAHKPIVDALEESQAPAQAKRVLNNLIKLVWPLFTLPLLFIMTEVAQSEAIGLEVGISQAAMKVLLAWIVIRIAVQFIANSLVRNIFAISIWAIAVLSIFGILDETTATLDAIGVNIGDLRLSALAVIKGIFSIFILLYLAMFGSSFLERRVLESKSLTRSSQVLIAKVIRITLVVFALLIGITSAGIDLSLFAVFGGAIGLGIGFGLQKGISNLFSGMLLLMDKSIQPGDVLEMENGTFGWVQHMGARYTEVVTRDNKSFLIPNEDFITQRVVNWSHGDTLIRLEVTFGVGYQHNPHEVRKIAAEAIMNCDERICSDPEPVCHLAEFGDSSLNFKLRFWIKDAEKGVTNIRGTAMLALWDAFEANAITIPYPHREVIITETKKAS